MGVRVVASKVLRCDSGVGPAANPYPPPSKEGGFPFA